MKRIANSIVPFKGFKAMTLWPFIFTRKEARVTATMLRHESIHGEQQKEMLLVFFLLWYGMEWVVRLIIYRNGHKAYKMISFEQEAYLNEYDEDYLPVRRHYSFLKYIV